MLLLWAGFIVIVVLMLLFDLCVLHRKSAVISLKSALLWSVIWTLVAFVFNVGVYYIYKHDWMGITTQRLAAEQARSAETQPAAGAQDDSPEAIAAADRRIARLAS